MHYFRICFGEETSIKSIRLDGNGKICGEKRTQIETTLLERAGGNAQVFSERRE
jgi:hypothetical protein